MNTTPVEGVALAKEIVAVMETESDNHKIILAPPFTHLAAVVDVVENNPIISVAAQNCHQEKSGAYTGEISAAILAEMGLSSVIIGHSERREYFAETDQLLAQKVRAALGNGLTPIFCCGETLDEREAGTHFETVEHQLKDGLFHLSTSEIKNVVIAYEPVWAIGTGKTATPEIAQEMHAFIRKLVVNKYSQEVADNLSLLYGGSCKPSNAKELFSMPDIDGGLIGGASLKSEDFLAIFSAL